ncbi:AI-2E family transporter [Candidatus Uhrbacteria bacterium]|nr:AI-2E family transporter [Candidatus Uhrbacteria bacterium]
MGEAPKMEFTVRAGTLVKIVAIAALAALLFYLRDIVALVVVAVVLAILISPVADFCERHRLPRPLGVLVVYLVVLGALGILFTLIAQPIIIEVRNLAGTIPGAWERIITATESLRAFSIEHGLADQLRQFASGLEGSITAGIFGALSGAFGGVLSLLLVLVLTFYLSTYATVARRTMIAMAPERWQPFLIGVVPRIERKMGSWLRGLLALGAIMGVLVFIGLSVLRVEYALLLAFLAAFAEAVPYVGAISATIIAVLLTALQTPAKAIVVLILFVVLQQLENHLLVPKVMHRAVGVNPVVSLLAILIGAKIGGIPGALLAIPITAGIIVFSEEYARERRSQQS